MNRFNIVLAIMICCMLSACGFKPIYSESKSGLPVKLGSVRVLNNEPGKLDYTFKQAMSDAFGGYDNNQNTYTLDVEIIKSTINFDTQNNRITTRNRLDLRANFKLLDKNRELVLEDFATVSDSYEVTPSPYSSLVSEEGTTNLLAKTLAQEIVMRLLDVINQQ